MKTNIFIIFNFFLSVCVWYLTYLAKGAEYDRNYALIIDSLLLSSISSVISLIALKKNFNKSNKKLVVSCIIFLVIASPISIIVFIKMYAFITGGFFKL